jgi:hypothetical protein
MAKVQTGDYIAVWQKKVICSHPTTPLTGNLCRVGDETGIALTSEATTDTGLTGNLTGLYYCDGWTVSRESTC